ncbi:hypothetical protein DINM_002255 [Dirofilaria immitis]|nr:hypothetical protein [Dirofilaria immitis]
MLKRSNILQFIIYSTNITELNLKYHKRLKTKLACEPEDRANGIDDECCVCTAACIGSSLSLQSQSVLPELCCPRAINENKMRMSCIICRRDIARLQYSRPSRSVQIRKQQSLLIDDSNNKNSTTSAAAAFTTIHVLNNAICCSPEIIRSTSEYCRCEDVNHNIVEMFGTFVIEFLCRKLVVLHR